MKHLSSIIIAALLAIGALGSVALAVEPAKELTKSELKTLIQTANTSEDHMRLATYYHAQATRLETEATDHGEMIAAYEKNKLAYSPKHPTMEDHCNTWAKLNREFQSCQG